MSVCTGFAGRKAVPPCRQVNSFPQPLPIVKLGRPVVNWRDIQALDAERSGGVVAEVRLRGEGVGAGIAHAELVEERRAEEVCFVDGKALCDEGVFWMPAT